MKLFQNHERLKPFPCPECGEYLASESDCCRYCGAGIDPDYARDAAQREKLANRVYR
jgi:predicted RNA-binding Zn-ribbon protein involved in translation (DUF1610 family)